MHIVYKNSFSCRGRCPHRPAIRADAGIRPYNFESNVHKNVKRNSLIYETY